MEKTELTTSELQKRFGDKCEIRSSEVRAAKDGELVVEGYAAVFEQETNLGIFREKIARGAFDNVLENDVRLLLNHDGAPFARTTNGTLELSVDEVGLKYRAQLIDTQAGRDLHKSIQRGDISQSSFAFTIEEQSWSDDKQQRTVEKVGSLLDVSAVTYPAYNQASVFARNAAQRALETQEQVSDTAEDMESAPEAPKTRQNENLKSAKFGDNKNTKKMTMHDMKGQRAAYYEEFVAIGANCETEGRSMTEAEQERADKLDEMIQDLDVKIRHKQREQEMVSRLAGAPVGKSEEKEIRSMNHRFSLSRAIKQATEQRMEGVEAEWAAEAQREMRGFGKQPQGQIGIPSIAFRAGAADNFQAGSGDGSGFVATDVPFSIEALREPTFLQQLGVQAINATGDLKFPRISNPALAVEKTEIAASTGSGMELDEVSMSPTRVTTQTTYSKQVILQGGAEVDRLISGDIQQEMSAFIDRAGFAAILASTEVNDQSTSGTGTANGTTFDASLAIAMETAVLAAEGDLSGANYVMSPYAYQLSKTLPLISGIKALFENGQFNGYAARATAHVANTSAAEGQVIFGNFRQGLLLAYFGGVDLLVDPFSSAANAQVTLHVNRYFDVAVRQGGAFSICTDVVA